MQCILRAALNTVKQRYELELEVTTQFRSYSASKCSAVRDIVQKETQHDGFCRILQDTANSASTIGKSSSHTHTLTPYTSSQGPTSKLHVTVGNKSCDLDSMVCALAYAHYSAVARGDDWINIPLFACTKDEFDLRPEAVSVLSEAGIQSEWLVFSDDLPEKKMTSVEQLEVTLVDHNAPTLLLAGSVVRGVCDV